MEAMEAILTRRSVRHFTSKSVQSEHVTLLLKAGMQAKRQYDLHRQIQQY